jgi:hypothetical protein
LHCFLSLSIPISLSSALLINTSLSLYFIRIEGWYCYLMNYVISKGILIHFQWLLQSRQKKKGIHSLHPSAINIFWNKSTKRYTKIMSTQLHLTPNIVCVYIYIYIYIYKYNKFSTSKK